MVERMPFEIARYRPRKISEIDLENDRKVAIIGRIKEILENGFVLADPSGQVEIGFAGDMAERGKIVRVFCSVVDRRLVLDILQSLEGLDLELYEEVEQLYKKANLNY